MWKKVDEKGKEGKADGKKQKERMQRSKTRHNPNPSKDAVCWNCGKRRPLGTRNVGRTQRMSLALAEAKTKEAKENRKMTQARALAFGTRRSSCSDGSTTANGTCELSGLGVDSNSYQVTAPG